MNALNPYVRGDIEGTKKIFGITVPIVPTHRILYPKELRVNLTYFYQYCEVCSGQRVHFFCSTEGKWTCMVCNDFCDRFAHVWEETSASLWR